PLRAIVEFRAEFFNVFNHTKFFTRETQTITTTTFGQVSDTFNPRIGFAQKVLILGFLCATSVSSVSLWCGFTRNSSTTETQRTQRLHRNERDRDFLCKAMRGVAYRFTRGGLVQPKTSRFRNRSRLRASIQKKAILP